MSTEIELKVFFELRDKADAAIGELQSWAETHFTGKTVKWVHGDFIQEGIVLGVVEEAVVVKNTKTKKEVKVGFSKILEISY